MPRSSHELMQMLKTLDQRTKAKYYTICAIVEKKLMDRGYKRLNQPQCRYICEHLKIEKKMTMGELVQLSDGKVEVPAWAVEQKTEDQGKLFE